MIHSVRIFCHQCVIYFLPPPKAGEGNNIFGLGNTAQRLAAAFIHLFSKLFVDFSLIYKGLSQKSPRLAKKSTQNLLANLCAMLPLFCGM